MLSAPPGRRDAAASGDELAAILRACADRVSGSRERLKAFYGESLTGRLGRTLAERALNEPSLQAALDDAWAEADSFDPSRESAEEWLFGRVRQARGLVQRAPAARSVPGRQPAPPAPEPEPPPPPPAARESEPPPAPAAPPPRPPQPSRAEAPPPSGGFWPPPRQPQQARPPAAVAPPAPPRPIPAPVPPPVMREPPPPPPPAPSREEPRRVVEPPPPPVAEVPPEPPPRRRIVEEVPPSSPPERSPRPQAGLREAAAPSFDPTPAERRFAPEPDPQPRMSARITAVRPGRDRPVIYYDPERERAKAGGGSWRVFLVLLVLVALGASAAVFGPRLMAGGLPPVLARATEWLPRDWLPAALRPEPAQQQAPIDLGAPLSAPEAARAPVAPPPVRSETVPAQAPPAASPRAVAPAAPATGGAVAAPRPANRSEAPEPSAAPSDGGGGRVRVFVHYSAIGGDEAGEAQRVAEQLQQQGFDVAELRPVPFRIGTGGVRYFFRDDRREANRLRVACARLLGPEASRLGGGQPSDFTRYEPKPAPGTVEVWLPSASS